MKTGQANGIGGIVVCGGQSTRMGRSKAWLSFGSEPMLVRVVRVVAQVVAPVVVVAAPRQRLPKLPAGVTIVRDEDEALGPLAALAAGLQALAGVSQAAYLSGCDAPLLSPRFVARVVAALHDDELAIPREGKFRHPLAAVYRTSLAPRVRRLLAADRLRLLDLCRLSRVRDIDVAELRVVDPRLDSLRNVNTPEDYAAALAAAGLAR